MRSLWIWIFWLSAACQAAAPLKEAILRRTILPWIYTKSPAFKNRVATLTDQQIQQCATRIARAIGRSSVYAKMSKQKQADIVSVHTERIADVLKEERLIAENNALTVDEQLDYEANQTQDIPKESMRLQREKELNQRFASASYPEARQALQTMIHAALESEIKHRVYVARICPSIIDFPNERFLYLWKTLTERSHITPQELKHFLTMVKVIEKLNRDAESNSRYQAYLKKKKTSAELKNKIMQARQQLFESCCTHAKTSKTRLHDLLCTKAALSMMQGQCRHPASEEQKEAMKGYIVTIQDLPVWSHQLITAVFTPPCVRPCDESLQNTYTLLTKLNQDINAVYQDDRQGQRLVADFLQSYPKHVSFIKERLGLSSF